MCWGKYILPIDEFFRENEVIQVNNGTIYLEIMFQGLDPNGDPVIVVNKKSSKRPANR